MGVLRVTVAARLSLIVAVHEHVAGSFPYVRTYPAGLERRMEGEAVKVFAASGEVAAGGTVLDVADTLTKVRCWVVENVEPAELSGVADVTVTGGPVNGTVPRGQVLFATNDTGDGWPAASVTVTGTPGTAYKVIAVGE